MNYSTGYWGIRIELSNHARGHPIAFILPLDFLTTFSDLGISALFLNSPLYMYDVRVVCTQTQTPHTHAHTHTHTHINIQTLIYTYKH